MSTPSPFQVARDTSNNFGNSFKRVKDETAIEQILSQALNTGSPEVIQNSIGQILSQVSPERQGMALQYLQNTFQTLQKKKETEQTQATGQQAAQEAGYTYGVPPAVAAQQVKDRAKQGRLGQYGLGDQPSQIQPTNIPGAQPSLTTPQQNLGSVFRRLSDDQLVVASGAADKEIAEPAKAELKRRDEERKVKQRQESDLVKNDLSRSGKVLERADTIAEQIPQKRTAINLMKDAVANRNLAFFSRDNLAELTGIEGFRSPEGAIFKTAGKEYFLGNIARAGARPNQWIEQQISDMLAKIGRTPEANFSVLRALENELDLDEARVRITQEASDRLRSAGDIGQGKLGSLVNKELSKYAEERQDVLFNDLRAIKAIGEKNIQKFRKVLKGTPVSDFMAQALLQQFNNDPKKAADEAKKLGYEF